MTQAADLIVEIDVDSQQAQAELAKLEKTLGVTASRASASGKKLDQGFGSKLKQTMREAAGATAKIAEPLDRVEKEARQAEAASQKMLRSFGKQKFQALANANAVGKLDKAHSKHNATVAAMRRQAEGARKSLERLFREGAVDAKQFQRQLAILDDAIGEIKRGALPEPKPKAGAAFGKLALKIGGAVVAYQSLKAAAQTAIRFVGSSIAAAAAQEDAENALAAALERTGGASARLQEELEDQAKALQATTRFGDESIIKVQALGVSMGIGADHIGKATVAALDMATALDMDLESAMRNMAKTTGGYAGELGELIPELKDLTKEQLQAGEGIDLLASKFAGRAARDVETFSGRVDQLKNAWGDAKERFGQAATESDELKSAMGQLASTLPDVGDKLADLVEDLAPAAAKAIELADGVLGIVTASDGFDVGNLQGISKEMSAAQQRTLGLKQRIADLENHEWSWATGLSDVFSDALGQDELAGLKAELKEAIQAEKDLLESQRATREERAKAREEARKAAEEELARAAEQRRLDREREAAEKAKKKAKEKAAKAAKELAEAIAQPAKDMQRYAELAGSVDEMGLSLAEQGRLLEAMRAGGESAQQAVRKLFQDGKLEADEFTSSMASLKAQLASIAREQDALSGRRAALVDSLTQGMEPGFKRTEGGALGQDKFGEGGAETYMQGELAAAGEAEQAQAEALADLVMQYGELDLAMQQHALAQEEAVLRAEIEKAAIDGVTEAERAQIAVRLQSIQAQQREAAQAEAVAAIKKRSTVATLQAANATVGAAGSAIAAITKSSKAQVAIEAAQNVISGMTETALAYGAFARYDAWAGAQHTLAATAHFAAAAQAGKGGGGGGPSGGGGGGGDAPRDSPAMDSYRAVREDDREERGNRYEVIINSPLSLEAQETARQISSYLAQFDEDTGGRTADVRG